MTRDDLRGRQRSKTGDDGHPKEVCRSGSYALATEAKNMNKRQALLLALLAADDEGTVSGRTRLQKLVFLAQEEFSDDLNASEYEFYPYHYGPFSKDLLNDIEALEQAGLVSERNIDLQRGEKYIYELEDDGRDELRQFLSTLSPSDRQEIEERAELVETNFNDISVSRLLEYVYNQYESYAEESVL